MLEEQSNRVIGTITNNLGRYSGAKTKGGKNFF